jgi:peptide chain release factor 2
MGEPGFWDDQATAAKVSAEHARTTRKAESFAALQSDVDDLDGLIELAEEDPEMAAEVEEQFASGCSRDRMTRAMRS